MGSVALIPEDTTCSCYHSNDNFYGLCSMNLMQQNRREYIYDALRLSWRVWALLKIAEGMPAARVARQGLLRPRDPDTVYTWLDRYQATGHAGLKVRTGRGRKPAFSPSTRDGGGGPRRVATPLPA